MLSDARAAPDGTVFKADVAIVGAGPAGIAVALELQGRGLSVLLLESGGFEDDPDTEFLNDGTVVGNELIFNSEPLDLKAARRRGFGGTSSVWGGVCRPLDRIDLERRPEVDLPGWPFDYDTLAPFYGPAAALCNVLDEWAPEFWLDSVAGSVDLRSDGIDLPIFQRALPRKLFGRDHRRELVDAPDVEVCVWANVARLNVAPADDVVSSVDVRTTTGRQHRAEARFFVLAAGGIETPRLLLASRDTRPVGIGNENDLVGRYFMDHIVYSGGRVVTGFSADQTRLYGTLAVHQLPAHATADNTEQRHAITFAALASAVEVRRAEGLRGCAAMLVNWPEHVMNPLEFNDAVDPAAVAALMGRASSDQATVLPMIAVAEPRPDRENRVTLREEHDSLGVPKVELLWSPSSDDRAHLRRSLDLLAAELGRTGAGRMQVERNGVDLDEATLWIGAHHMGTTRMHADPTHGVVDANSRVHSTRNVFIAGSGVFPTAGFANPTLTIVALALRLGDHLAELAAA